MVSVLSNVKKASRPRWFNKTRRVMGVGSPFNSLRKYFVQSFGVVLELSEYETPCLHNHKYSMKTLKN